MRIVADHRHFCRSPDKALRAGLYDVVKASLTGSIIGNILLSVAIMALTSQDGESNWMEGVQLLAVYAILGIAFYFLPA